MEEDPKLDECRFVIFKMIEYSIRDYLALEFATAPIEQQYYQTAAGFLLDDDYRIDWGGSEKSLKDFLQIIGIDIEWFRYKVKRLKKKRRKELAIKKLIED